jgi:hypothetical protein
MKKGHGVPRLVRFVVFSLALLALLIAPPALAQDISINFGAGSLVQSYGSG